jgi:hypothetical protein
VTGTASPRVTKLEVRQKQLQADFATVLAALQDLPSLADIKLPGNGLTGLLVSPFSGFLKGSLMVLDVADNMLGLGSNGTAIAEFPQQLPNLRELCISRNPLNVSEEHERWTTHHGKRPYTS